MFFLDNESGVDVMPTIANKSSNTVKWFTEGDNVNPESWPGQDWFNMVQAELLNLLNSASITPDKANLNQLSAAIKKIISDNQITINDASLKQKGIVQLSSAINSDSEQMAATLKAVKTLYDLINSLKPKVGHIELMPFRKSDLPNNWYFANGDYYPLSSPQGQALNSLSSNFKTDWGIGVSGSNICLPNLFYADGRGVFLRAVNGVSRQVGSIQDDAMRLLVGSAGRFTGISFSNSGALYPANPAAAGIQSGSGGAQYVDLIFDNRLATTVAEENRPLNIGMTPAIYLEV